jgi:hypothetical protein
MTTEAISRPSSSYRTPRIALIAVVALIVGAFIGAGVVALTSSGGSEGAATTQRAVLPTAGTADVCAGDGGALLASVAAMPVDVSNDIMSRLSAPTRALLSTAAEMSAISESTPQMPDPETLAAVLSRVRPADAAALTGGLSPQTRAAIAATASGSACS